MNDTTDYLEETKALIRDVVVRNDVMSIILTVIASLFLLFVLVLAIREHVARMRIMRRRDRDFREWQDVQAAQNEIEVDAFGHVFYRLH